MSDEAMSQWLQTVRSQFPLLGQRVHAKPLVYLDSAATSQKPQVVLDAEREFYESVNAGVHRGAHELAARSTVAFEQARARIARLLGAGCEEGDEEIVVTGGATDGLNTLAIAFGNASLGRGGPAAKRFALTSSSRIVVTRAEHHSVLLAFQELAARTGAELAWLEVDASGRLRTDDLTSVIPTNTAIVAFTHVSNVTGAISDVCAIVRRAREVGALTILDACQSVMHMPINLHDMDVDFAVFSAHKAYGPLGVGFLYGKRELLEALPPARFGGSMVQLAWLNKPAQYMPPPARFEAGTQPVAQVVAASVALQWLNDQGWSKIAAHEQEITNALLEVQHIDGVRILGPIEAVNRTGVVSFEVDGVHPHDVGQFLDSQGIAIRVGHHCAQPIHRHFGVYASNRASAGIYTSVHEAHVFVDAVAKVRSFFS